MMLQHPIITIILLCFSSWGLAQGSCLHFYGVQGFEWWHSSPSILGCKKQKLSWILLFFVIVDYFGTSLIFYSVSKRLINFLWIKKSEKCDFFFSDFRLIFYLYAKFEPIIFRHPVYNIRKYIYMHTYIYIYMYIYTHKYVYIYI